MKEQIEVNVSTGDVVSEATEDANAIEILDEDTENQEIPYEQDVNKTK